MIQKIEQHFLLIIVVFLSLSLLFPQAFIGLKWVIPVGLGVIIFSIGLNTSIYCLKPVLSRPTSILSLILLRYAFMPSAAFVLAKLCHLTQIETIGLIILGTSPGGTAANVMAYLSGSNVAMTVLLTFGTTLLSPFVTPALIYWFLHQEVQIDFWGMFVHISSLILLPITAGVLLNYFKVPAIEKLKNWTPSLAIIIIGILVGCVCALTHETLLKTPMTLILLVAALNSLGYTFGWMVARLFCWEKSCVAAVAFDYGIFDCVVTISICTTFFSIETAVPAVLMGVIQSMTAPLLVRKIKRTLALSIG
ncbi:MAG: bile acid:sodium symporter family protein [Gammaproteobacteria bacterium]|nr:bile acid:sodium symporter family protein [Gammaproteobacteria bacterium]